MEPLRIAVVGAGPAGIYTTGALAEQAEIPVQVDLFDRLPTPFGLLRYGVAPDHLKIKRIEESLQLALEHDEVRFFGNVECGTQVTVEELRERYHAVVYAFGAAADRRLGIPGEDLYGSVAAREFVAWYCGLPDELAPDGVLAHPGVAVIGVGNVALDVARVLASPVERLHVTDMPSSVLTTLSYSSVSDIHLLGRRRPQDAKFTTKELREFLEIEDLDVIVDPADLVLDEAEERAVAADPVARRNLAVLQEMAVRPRTGAPRRLYLHFCTRPVQIMGTSRVEGLRVERAPRPAGWPQDTPEVFDVGMVMRAVGYLGRPMEGVPFDKARGVIPSCDSRVLRDGEPAPGEYVSGWIGRGATGVVGTNKADGKATAEAILADAVRLRRPLRDDIDDLLRERVPSVVTLDGWAAIKAAEIQLGQESGRASAKLAQTNAMLVVAERAQRESEV